MMWQSLAQLAKNSGWKRLYVELQDLFPSESILFGFAISWAHEGNTADPEANRCL